MLRLIILNIVAFTDTLTVNNMIRLRYFVSISLCYLPYYGEYRFSVGEPFFNNSASETNRIQAERGNQGC